VAEGCPPSPLIERLLWRKFLANEGKILKPRILHHASIVIPPEQTLRIRLRAAATDPQRTLNISINSRYHANSV
jgi:hypothetical protein